LRGVLAPLLDGRTLASSDERKAIETAAALVDDVTTVRVSPDFREIDHPWIESGHTETALRYLAGESIAGWEDQDDAVVRFRSGLEQLGSPRVAVASHGTVVTLFIASVVATIEPAAFWTGLSMPDAWLLDVAAGTLARVA
jgi:broad specificity phosphatase PhoE